MILHPVDDEDYENILRQLIVINTMRSYPRLIPDTPWIQTKKPRPEYL